MENLEETVTEEIRDDIREAHHMFCSKKSDEHGRVARALDLAGITNTVGAPFLRDLCEGRESGMPAQVG